MLPPGIAEAAKHRADRIGVGADRVLIAVGRLSEDRYVTALAAYLGIPFEPLETMPRHACMLSDERLPAAAAAGLLPLRLSSDFVWVVAPRGVAARRLIGLVRLHPALRERLRLTTAARITRFANRHGSRSIGLLAADGLRTAKPQFSAATRSRFHPLLLAAAVIGICAAIAPAISVAVLDAALVTLFLGWIVMRFAAAALRVKPARVEQVHDQSLPTYTIIVALYREARAVPGLVHALKQLDYPAEKLDVKFVIEPDDRETKDAFASARLGPPFEIIVAPAVGPRTKPKALNAALPFARGAYTVIYDAEDRPEPDQLRQAIASFRSGNEHLACVQARLTIDNTADSLLTRLFTAEYAGLFDVLLPSLADRDLPLPLGGSSNHFRTDILRAIGAWDAYNVTEDADLGMRLARFGYHSHVIRSTTHEEAPARLTPWIKQRTRWFKGWMRPVNGLILFILINVLEVIRTHFVAPIATLSQHRNEFRALIARLRSSANIVGTGIP